MANRIITSDELGDLIYESLSAAGQLPSQRLKSCRHEQWTENKATWIETCSNCGAWRDRTNAPAISWSWRDPITGRPLSPPTREE